MYHIAYKCFISIVLSLVYSNKVTIATLPSINPQEFSEDEVIPVQVNVVTSLRTHLPYDYYKNFPTCLPKSPISHKSSNIGGILMGDRIKSSPYENIRILKNITCQVVCEKTMKNEKQQKFLKKAIEKGYRINLLMDGLPLAEEVSERKIYKVGIPLGFVSNGRSYINNHIHFLIKCTAEEAKNSDNLIEKRYRILSFVAKPYSIQYNADRTCDSSKEMTFMEAHHLPVDSDSITWSYSVSWSISDDAWTSRWDVYLSVREQKVHWYSIISSVLSAFSLTAIIAVVLVRAVWRDLGKSSGIDIDDFEPLDSIGWKLLARDVFRPPDMGWMLACFAGSGVQLLGMAYAVLFLGSMGFFSPQSRGSLFSAIIACFALMGISSGYISARILKLWNTTKWKYVLATGTTVPAISFGTFLIINFLVWLQSSSAAVSFFSLIAIMSIWFFISLPLVFAGAILGFKQTTLLVPSSCSQIPRHIPRQPWYTSIPSLILAGFPPFITIFVEVYFILGAIWLNKFYHVFGILLLVSLLFLIITAETVVVVIYFILCAEDYRWWWKSYVVGASSGVYLFMYSVICVLCGGLKIEGAIPIIQYVGYMGLISFLFSVASGTIGFISCFCFLKYIYCFVKTD
ncbi:putative Endomembrane protein 70 [Trypanosoma vivax]|nr:putative endosomal integral membrane protein [Trypanosoma vivax]KAH8613570.1 putative Endomembrane protein 70 [Trypanosoma vivax]